MGNKTAFIDEERFLAKDKYSRLLYAACQWIDTQSKQVITVLNEDLKIVYISSSTYQVFGYDASNFLHKSVLDFIPSEEHQLIFEHMKRLNYDSRSLEHKVIRKDGRIITVQSSSGIIIDSNTNENYYISLTQDITDQKKAQELLISSEKLTSAGQLAAGVAHEIRNPLTSLKGFLQLLETGIEGKEAYLKIMKDEIEKIETISSELLYIARPSHLKFEDENMVAILNDICLLMRSQARMNDIQIEFEPLDDQIKFRCDRSQIKQVFINLIKNAIEATEESGTIAVNIVQSNPLIVDVVDEGPGVPNEMKEKLGEPFFTTKKNGSGLGLMVTKQILSNHDATIKILDNEDKGSTFRVTFPS
ncbi:PAS domain-containing sensor histidine kinase [Halalkalibacillus sediminis]|uniref:histidine kinase n=1 Tax=Halalkalibacillus sediminis TaxID=2018042 RepID=A0A2I0QX84_9BACI|nr:ATP-binding protein [Halalkalibacillus sediminis]PKR78720.1 PAS domain-containing sensor histidine kinase [Halalkalibacillus sediminis]